MSDEDLTQEAEGDSSIIRVLRREIAKANRRAEAAEERSLRAEALMRANLGGLPEKQLEALAKVHDGEWTPEALLQTAEELGIDATQNSFPAAEAQALRRLGEITAGGPSGGPTGPTLAEQAMIELDPRQLTQKEFWAKARSMGLASEP